VVARDVLAEGDLAGGIDDWVHLDRPGAASSSRSVVVTVAARRVVT
jgi:hypothetical protein